MKKITFTLFSLFAIVMLQAQTTLVKIDGDDVQPANNMCYSSQSTENNAGVFLCITDEVSFYEAKTGSNRVVGLATGQTGAAIRSQFAYSTATPRFWYVGNINTTNFKDVKVSAYLSGMTSGSSNYEPARDWIFQYCVGDPAMLGEEAVWNDLPNNTISIKVGSWSNASFVLPNTCNNQEAISVRWAHTLDGVGINGGAANQNGWAYIDEILVSGTEDTGSSIKNETIALTIKSADNTIIVEGITGSYALYTIDGKHLATGSVSEGTNIATSSKGLYLLKLTTTDGEMFTKIINL